MTSPIGPSNNPFPSALNSLSGGRSPRGSATGGNQESPSTQQDSVRPALPSGPLGHNVNTTA
jgi:hypothetical protein